MAPAAFTLRSAKPVCVMDASGRLGSSLVRKLLQLGYTVHASLFNHGKFNIDPDKGLSAEASGRLVVFRSDPFDYQSIVDSVKGCSGLFYTFEPPLDDPNYDELTVEMEVRAAHNALEACAQTDAMERVVFTSSVTAVVWKADRKSADDDFDERDWSDPNFCRKFKLWHAMAKTLSEKTAWALAMDRGVDMVSVNAGLMTDHEMSASAPCFKGTREMYDDGVLVTVGVESVVDAHICVYEWPTAYGRYVCFDHAICRPEDAVEFSGLFAPSVPRSLLSDELRVIQQRIKNKKLNKAIMEYAGGAYEHH